MEPPKSEITKQIISIIENRREMEAAIKELKERANTLVASIADKEDKIDAAAYLYWLYPEIRAKELAQAVTGENNIANFLDSIHSVTANIKCERCGKLIEVRSRTQLIEERKLVNSPHSSWLKSYRISCKSCKEKAKTELRKQIEEEETYKMDRLNQLRKMPYIDYLQTSEWMERRKWHLSSADYCCQICGSSNEALDVYHKTDERRGQESFNDLIVLCHNCCTLLHESGKLKEHIVQASLCHSVMSKQRSENVEETNSK